MSENWALRAACIGKGEIIFGDDHDAAKAICARCPVRKPCLKTALDVDDLDGVWGGLTPAERTRICPICLKPKEPDELGCSGQHTLERLARLVEQEIAGDPTVRVSFRSKPTAPTSAGCVQPRGCSHSSPKAYRQGCRCPPALTSFKAQWLAAREVQETPYEARSARERFEALIVKDGDHWYWTGSQNGSGYANFWDGKKTIRAHLFAYRSFIGDLPPGARLKAGDKRASDGRPCVNPEHFEVISGGRYS